MISSIPNRYEVRPAAAGDVDQLARLFEQLDRGLGVPHDPVREFLMWRWGLPRTDLERDTRVVVADDAVIAFSLGMWRPGEGGPLILLVRVDLEHLGAGIGTLLLSWGEALSRELGAEGVRADVVDRDRRGHDLLRARGYRQVRSSFTMTKRLEPDENPGAVPAGVTIRPYGDADERALFEVHEASFADHWEFSPTTFEIFTEELQGEDWDPSLVFLAGSGGELVGHVASFAFEDEGYVGILGVLPAWRGRGIAKALLRRSFAELVSRGKAKVRLEVDAQNPHGAVALYEGVGMKVHRTYDIFDLGTTEVRRG